MENKVSTQKWETEEKYVNEKRLFTNAKKKNAGLFVSETDNKNVDSPKKVNQTHECCRNLDELIASFSLFEIFTSIFYF